ncbi:MAG: hypothetical protein IJC68_02380 [Firmicutes bacterium]|nr:hypothetical protein [Bacillota bacterium]
MNDELDKKDILTDETDDILSRFDKISDRLEKSGPLSEEESSDEEQPSTTERIAARRAARHQQKEKSFVEKASDSLAKAVASVIIAGRKVFSGKKAAPADVPADAAAPQQEAEPASPSRIPTSPPGKFPLPHRKLLPCPGIPSLYRLPL